MQDFARNFATTFSSRSKLAASAQEKPRALVETRRIHTDDCPGIQPDNDRVAASFSAGIPIEKAPEKTTRDQPDPADDPGFAAIPKRISSVAPALIKEPAIKEAPPNDLQPRSRKVRYAISMNYQWKHAIMVCENRRKLFTGHFPIWKAH
ncbi:MAG: hypothetical protein KKG47_10540 [Proteobacteria bacterium]|nr:hypothetical protein [Pseudomonadota bacterium]MBU1737585.1 hypothetical protein [Pseudomonadota bacterium]